MWQMVRKPKNRNTHRCLIHFDISIDHIGGKFLNKTIKHINVSGWFRIDGFDVNDGF